MSKVTVAIDLDGVCYEWSKTARYLMREYRGHSRQGPMGTESTSWDYIQENVSKADWKWLWSEGVKAGLFRYGHLVQGAVLGLRALNENGFKLVAVTHRPSTAVRDTMAWLSLLDIPWSGIHILTNQESKTTVEADILLDDKPQNITEWTAAYRYGVLFMRSWNQDFRPWEHKLCYGAQSWPDAVSIITNLGKQVQYGKNKMKGESA